MNSPRRKTPPNPFSPARNDAARAYDRMVQLPGLIGMWPSEIQDRSAAVTVKILALLRRALRSERARGRAGHWTYDLNRHLALAESLKAERSHLRSLDSAPAAPQSVAAKRAVGREKILHLPGFAARSREDTSDIKPDQPVFFWPVLAESS